MTPGFNNKIQYKSGINRTTKRHHCPPKVTYTAKSFIFHPKCSINISNSNKYLLSIDILLFIKKLAVHLEQIKSLFSILMQHKNNHLQNKGSFIIFYEQTAY